MCSKLCQFFVPQTLFFLKGSELLEAMDLLLGEFPSFSVQFDEYFDDFPFRVRQQRNNKSRVNSGRRFFQVSCYLKWSDWRARGCCSEQKYLLLYNTVDECFQKLVPVLPLWKCKLKVGNMAPEGLDNVLSNRPRAWIFVGRIWRNRQESMEKSKDCLTLSSYQWIQKKSKRRFQPTQYKCISVDSEKNILLHMP